MPILGNRTFGPITQTPRAAASDEDRQQKFIDRVNEQIALATAEKNGKTYTGADGKAVRSWHKKTSNGYKVVPRYGTQPLEIDGGYETTCDDLDDVLALYNDLLRVARKGLLTDTINTAVSKKKGKEAA